MIPVLVRFGTFVAVLCLVVLAGAQSPTDGLSCSTDTACDDNNMCTINKCNTTSNTCYSTPRVCDDGKNCSTQTCHQEFGCIFEKIRCRPPAPCQKGKCIEELGGICQFTPIENCTVCPSPRVLCGAQYQFCCPTGLDCVNDECKLVRPTPTPLPVGCDGVVGSGKHFDVCGVCGGNGMSCMDCNGTINGTLSFDDCGVCGGDGSACNFTSADCDIVFELKELVKCNIEKIDDFWFRLTGKLGSFSSAGVYAGDMPNVNECVMAFDYYNNITNLGDCDSRTNCSIQENGWPGIFADNVCQNNFWNRSTVVEHDMEVCKFERVFGLKDLRGCRNVFGNKVLFTETLQNEYRYSSRVMLTVTAPRSNDSTDGEITRISKPCDFVLHVDRKNVLTPEIKHESLNLKVYYYATNWDDENGVFQVIFSTFVNHLDQYHLGDVETTRLQFFELVDLPSNVTWELQPIFGGHCSGNNKNALRRCEQRWVLIGTPSVMNTKTVEVIPLTFKVIVNTGRPTLHGTTYQEEIRNKIHLNLTVTLNKDIQDGDYTSRYRAKAHLFRVLDHPGAHLPHGAEVIANKTLLPYRVDDGSLQDCSKICLTVKPDLKPSDVDLFTLRISAIQICVDPHGQAIQDCNNVPADQLRTVYIRSYYNPETQVTEEYFNEKFNVHLHDEMFEQQGFAFVCFEAKKLVAEDYAVYTIKVVYEILNTDGHAVHINSMQLLKEHNNPSLKALPAASTSMAVQPMSPNKPTLDLTNVLKTSQVMPLDFKQNLLSFKDKYSKHRTYSQYGAHCPQYQKFDAYIGECVYADEVHRRTSLPSNYSVGLFAFLIIGSFCVLAVYWFFYHTGFGHHGHYGVHEGIGTSLDLATLTEKQKEARRIQKELEEEKMNERKSY